MDAIRLLLGLRGDQIPTAPDSARVGATLFCQEDIDCDCRGCDDSG